MRVAESSRPVIELNGHVERWTLNNLVNLLKVADSSVRELKGLIAAMKSRRPPVLLKVAWRDYAFDGKLLPHDLNPEFHKYTEKERSLLRGWAGNVVNSAIANETLPRPTEYECCDCGAPAIEYDHRDYLQPLLVDPVCHSCNLLRGPSVPVVQAVTSIGPDLFKDFWLD